ncbi:hypothetical protein EVAR_33903_1 [Eumeta japonica]|uniref:Uncharacterized protein n=1 Tax=Eumeta variegata TaxID=151549 RepID=A0A4C1WKY4_EUMVA|nr:hypothetical protein EVAR_33903_1 [Eumeta japonica]
MGNLRHVVGQTLVCKYVRGPRPKVAFFARGSDVKTQPPAAASVGRVTEQSGGGILELRRAHVSCDAPGVGHRRGNNRNN